MFYFRTADFFGGADFLRGVRLGGLRASLTALPGWNRTALREAISMVSPLCGFRPWRAGRSATLKLPRPETRTASPATRESRIAVTTALTACPAAVWFSSVARATFSINSDWFISDVQLQHYEIPTLARAGSEVRAFTRVRARVGTRVAAIYRQHRATAMSNLQYPEDCSTRLILSATCRAYEPRHRPGRLGSRLWPAIQGRPPATLSFRRVRVARQE